MEHNVEFYANQYDPVIYYAQILVSVVLAFTGPWKGKTSLFSGGLGVKTRRKILALDLVTLAQIDPDAGVLALDTQLLVPENRGLLLPLVEGFLENGKAGIQGVGFVTREAGLCLHVRGSLPIRESFCEADLYGYLDELNQTIDRVLCRLSQEQGPAAAESDRFLQDQTEELGCGGYEEIPM